MGFCPLKKYLPAPHGLDTPFRGLIEGRSHCWTFDFQPGSSRGALISVEQGAEQTHPLSWPACSHHWFPDSRWGRIYKDSTYFLENGEIKKTRFKWWEKSNVVFTLYLPLALITAPESCTLWQSPLGLLLPMLSIYADIQRIRAAALASHKLELVAKFVFKCWSNCQLPHQNHCAFHSTISLFSPQSSSTIPMKHPGIMLQDGFLQLATSKFSK